MQFNYPFAKRPHFLANAGWFVFRWLAKSYREFLALLTINPVVVDYRDNHVGCNQCVVAQHGKIVIRETAFLFLLGRVVNLTRSKFLVHIGHNHDTVPDGTLCQIFRTNLPPNFELGVVAGLIGVGIQDEYGGGDSICSINQPRPFCDPSDVRSPRRKFDALNDLSCSLNPQDIDPQVHLVGQCG